MSSKEYPHGPKLCLPLCRIRGTGTIPHLFLRYIDGYIGHRDHEQFINFTNTFRPNLKFTWTISDTSLPFLDLSVSISAPSPTPGTFPCNRRKCYICPYTSSLTPLPGPKTTFHIKQIFTCTFVNVVYCICCFRCGLLYIGETKRRLGNRFVEHLLSVCDKRQHLPVANHFNCPSHSLDNMSILGLLQCHNNAT
eukprot:g23929.t1